MLVRPDATFLDTATKQAARVFPTGSAWLNFESRLPGKEIWENSNKDPALSTFANAEWQNWVSSTQVAVFELATRVGVPPLSNTPLGSGLASIFNSIPGTLAGVRDLEDPLTADSRRSRAIRRGVAGRPATRSSSSTPAMARPSGSCPAPGSCSACSKRRTASMRRCAAARSTATTSGVERSIAGAWPA
ncbi:hypothetical protein ACNOYE_34805 [Nannocystaceae bacterium ST9]